MAKVSGIYKYEGRTYRYNFDRCLVELVWKPSKKALAEIEADNREWMEKHNRPLWDIDESGCIVMSSVGLRPENWKRKGLRDEYLWNWHCDLCYEFENL